MFLWLEGLELKKVYGIRAVKIRKKESQSTFMDNNGISVLEAQQETTYAGVCVLDCKMKMNLRARLIPFLRFFYPGCLDKSRIFMEFMRELVDFGIKSQ